MTFQGSIFLSVKYALKQLEKKFSSDIKSIEKYKDKKDRLYKEIMKIYDKDWNYDERGNGQLLPAYYVLRREYELAWLLSMMLHIRWKAQRNEVERLELEDPDYNDAKPFTNVFENPNDAEGSLYGWLSPFSVTNLKYNDDLYQARLNGDIYPREPPYDISPSARYKQVGDDKNYYMSFFSMFHHLTIFPDIFRQERNDDISEMLLRMRYILSTGEPPKIMTETLKHRHYAPYFNMYDRWFQARLSNDKEQRTSLAWESVFWYIETGLRAINTGDIRELIKFTDLCEIIGEFDLMEDHQEEFLRNFKKWTMHASISHFKKMQINPVKMIPFSERNVPTYDEFRAIYRELKGE